MSSKSFAFKSQGQRDLVVKATKRASVQSLENSTEKQSPVWLQACQKFAESLDEKDRKYYEKLSRKDGIQWKDLLMTAQVWHEGRTERSSLGRFVKKTTRRLSPQIKRFEKDYGKALDVFANMNPEIMSPIWAAVRVSMQFVLDTDARYFQVFDEVIRMCCDRLSGCNILEEAFDDEEFNDILTEAYMLLLKLCESTRIFYFKRISYKEWSSEADSIKTGLAEKLSRIEKMTGPLHVALSSQTKKGVDELQIYQRGQKITGLLKSLSSYGHHKYHAKAKAPRMDLHNSGDWIIAKDVYQQWKRGEGSALFWLSGIPGAGKTVIVSRIVDDLLATKYTSEAVVVYYYCDHGNESTLVAQNILQAVLLQLLEWLRAHHSSTADLFIEDLFDADRWMATDAGIISTIHRVIKHPGIPLSVSLILDGLNECKLEERQRLLDSLDRLGVGRAPDLSLKVLLSARSEEDIKMRLKERKQAPIGPAFESAYPSSCELGAMSLCSYWIERSDITDDITAFVEYQVHRNGGQYDHDERLLGMIKEKLKDNAAGMFLWVALQIKEIFGFEGDKTEQELEELLANLPRDLDETYLRALDRISSHQSALKVFKWLACSGRPLHLRELRIVLAIDKEDTAFNSKKLLPYTSVRRACSSLVVFNDNDPAQGVGGKPADRMRPEDQFGRIAHYTLLEFLINKKHEDEWFHINMNKAHEELAYVCLTFLCLSDFESQLITYNNTTLGLSNLSNLGSHQGASELANLTARDKFGRDLGSGKSRELIYKLARLSASGATFDVSKIQIKKPEVKVEALEDFVSYARAFWPLHTRRLLQPTGVSVERSGKEMEYYFEPLMDLLQKISTSTNNFLQQSLPWKHDRQLNSPAMRDWAIDNQHLLVLLASLRKPFTLASGITAKDAFYRCAKAGGALIMKKLLNTYYKHLECPKPAADIIIKECIKLAIERGYLDTVKVLCDWQLSQQASLWPSDASEFINIAAQFARTDIFEFFCSGDFIERLPEGYQELILQRYIDSHGRSPLYYAAESRAFGIIEFCKRTNQEANHDTTTLRLLTEKEDLEVLFCLADAAVFKVYAWAYPLERFCQNQRFEAALICLHGLKKCDPEDRTHEAITVAAMQAAVKNIWPEVVGAMLEVDSTNRNPRKAVANSPSVRDAFFPPFLDPANLSEAEAESYCLMLRQFCVAGASWAEGGLQQELFFKAATTGGKHAKRLLETLLEQGLDIDAISCDSTPKISNKLIPSPSLGPQKFRAKSSTDGEERKNRLSAAGETVKRKLVEPLRLLVEMGANLHIGGLEHPNYTLLHIAASVNAIEIGGFLIDQGTDMYYMAGSDTTSLHIALSLGHENFAEMLVRRGFVLNQTVGDVTPLILEIRRGTLETVKFLLDLGADPNLPSSTSGLPPIHYATDPEMVELLQERAKSYQPNRYYETRIMTGFRM